MIELFDFHTRFKAFCGAVALAMVAGCFPQGEATDGLSPISTGSLRVGVEGLPAGTDGAVVVTSAQGFQSTVPSTRTLTGLAPGAYTISAGEVTTSGDRYAPAPASQTVTVTASVAPVVSTVAYVAVTGRLSLTIAGHPAGSTPSVTVTGPGGYQHTATASELLSGLPAGTYQVQAPSITSGADRYDALVDPAVAQVTAGAGSPVPVTVTYALATGGLQLAVSGLPAGVPAAITVTGPQGHSVPVTASTALSGLLPGTYTITAAATTVGPDTWSPDPAVQTVVITANTAAEQRSVVYSVSQGSLAVVVSGLPGGVAANIIVSGPGGYLRNLAGSQTLGSLAPGSYTVSAAGASDGTVSYAPNPATQGVTVSAGATAVASVSYAASSGSLAVTVSGLPGGSAAAITVTGPGGYSHPVTASETLTGLAPGNYTIVAASVAAGGYSWGPTPGTQARSVTAGGAVNAAVSYAPTTGALTVTVSGLPGGTGANVTVSGPGGYSQPVTATQTLSGLAPGGYTITAASVTSGATTYTPTPLSQSPPVSAGSTGSASVTYSGSGGGAFLNLTINGVYLTQATQRYDGSVPLVAGRSAYLRVFAVANQSNTALPQVRVRLYSGATLVQTYTLGATGSGVPTSVNEGLLSSSWNVMVPGALVQPNLKVLADVDPAGGIAESDENDNQFPASGTPAPVDVRSLPTFTVRFVPVLQQVNGLQGNVTAGNQESFLNDLKQLLPVGAYDADLRAPYTTTAAALASDNGNSAWGTILSELLSLRFAEGSTRYYYGVVKTTYSSGVAGIGYVGGSARTALGWDYLPSGSSVMAHEVGHNMSRQHAPCGGVASPDPAFPYAGGKIGVWGLDLTTLVLKNPATFTDLMGYCSPVWVSDYNWSAMVDYRAGGPNNAPPAATVGSEGLLVWGRITAQGVILEPSFTVPAAPALAPAPGAHRLELAAADGTVLRTMGFDAQEVADLPGGTERHFAFVVPLDPGLRAGLGRITVRSGGRSASRLAAAAGDPAPVVTRPNDRQVELRWDAARYPMVMVRDAATGEVLSFARGGAARLWTRAGNFDLQFSDGVRTVVRQRRPLQ